MKKFRLSKETILTFVIRRNIIFSAIWGLVFGGIIIANAIGGVKAYPNPAAWAKVAATFATNTGLESIYGPAHNISTIVGFTVWKGMASVSIIAAIWGFIISTKVFRGEEESGRLEMLLSGQTNLRKATIDSFLGLFVCIFVMFIISFLLIIKFCNTDNLYFETGGTLLFSFGIVATALEFVAIGAFFSQLFSTRRQALSYSVITYGMFFLLRVVSISSTSLGWLLNINPIGWVDNLQPLTGNQVVWVLPIIGFVIVLVGLTIYFAGKRDLSSSVLAGYGDSKSRMYLLNSPFGFIIRQYQSSIITWLLSLSIGCIVIGSLAKVGGAALDQSSAIEKALGKISLAYVPSGAEYYLSFIFIIAILLLMMMVINSVSKLREEES